MGFRRLVPHEVTPLLTSGIPGPGPTLPGPQGPLEALKGPRVCGKATVLCSLWGTRLKTHLYFCSSRSGRGPRFCRYNLPPCHCCHNIGSVPFEVGPPRLESSRRGRSRFFPTEPSFPEDRPQAGPACGRPPPHAQRGGALLSSGGPRWGPRSPRDIFQFLQVRCVSWNSGIP